MNPLSTLRELARTGTINEMDYQFARFIGLRSNMDARLILLSAALSNDLGRMRSCVDLTEFCTRHELFGLHEFKPPGLGELLQLARDAPCIGAPGDARPMIIDNDRLYLNRYHQYEVRVAENLVKRAAGFHQGSIDSSDIDSPQVRNLRSVLERFFPGEPGEPNWQRVAAAIATTRKLTIITGGPGTGKSTAVVRILALLLDGAGETGESMRIRLAAPTGKAAMRLGESIRHLLEEEANLPCSRQIAESIPREVTTIHRLLGVRRQSPGFVHNQSNQLPLDLLVVDEASMIDLSLMASLLAALPDNAKLILVGDHHQLPSVDVGSILADLSPASEQVSPPGYSEPYGQLLTSLCGFDPGRTGGASDISDCFCELRKGHRFAADSDLGQLAHLLRRGDVDAIDKSLEIHGDPNTDEITLHAPDTILTNDGIMGLASGYTDWIEVVADDNRSTADKLAAFDRYRVLAALREGSHGVEELNTRIEANLEARGLIVRGVDSAWYPGRPVMITRNDYGLGLFNGDTGICLHNPDGDNWIICFPGKDGEIRALPPSRLPPHETCYVITIHKSQGSEFDEVAIVLPPTIEPHTGDLLCRELLYTAITRSRKRVSLYADRSMIAAVVRRTTNRGSGLRDRLARLNQGERDPSARKPA